MERKDIYERIENIFREILDDEDIVLSDTTVADDIDGWDSLTHVQLVVAIEKELGIRFTSREILSWKNVGQMVDTIQNKF
jgi:acyl carrier protein